MIKDAIKQYGSHHAIFSDLEQGDLENIRNHVDVEETGIGKTKGAARVVELTEEEKEMYGVNSSYRYI